MAEITVAAKKFTRLFNYLEHLGLNSQALGEQINLAPAAVASLAAHEALPA